MTEFRLVRQFDGKTSTSESRAYRVETVGLMTEQEAMQLMRDLGSPYQGQKYDDKPLAQYVAAGLGVPLIDPDHQHYWNWSGDDPYVTCECGQVRDALTGRVVRP